MQTYQTGDIRNLAIIGHSGSGKTILCEAMLACAKVIDRMGTIEAGNTVSDYQPDEQKRQVSISATPLHVEWQNKKINIIDTPGYSDFVGEVITALSVVDMALLTLSATQGLEVGSEQGWQLAADRNLPKLIAITALDKEHTKFDEVVADARERLGKRVFPLQIPLNAGPGFNQIGDVIRGKVTTYKTDGSGAYEENDPPAEIKEKLSRLHQELIECVAESDDALLEKFFEQGGLSEEELQAGLHAAFQNQSVVPVFCAAAQLNIGTRRLLDFIANYGSSPLDRPKMPAVNGEGQPQGELAIDNPQPALYVFKTISEAHVGDLSFFRVISGKVSVGMDLYNIARRKSERIGQLFLFNGKSRTSVNEISAGDIGTTVKLKDTHSGDTLGDSKSTLLVPPCHFPKPNLHFAVKPKSKGDEDKIGNGLATLHAEDPSFEYWVDREVKQTMIAGQGELHLQIAVEKLKRRFNVEVEIEAPRIPYRETVRGKGDSKFRHKKQTGGAGQFAEVWLTVEALPRGSGVEFAQSLVGQNVDRTFVPSVEKGVMAVCENGVIAGCRVVDVKANFYDGKQHPVDSKDIAFQIAGRGAFKEAFLAAKPCLLEPIYNITVKVPEEYMGAVMGDVSGRRGKILGMDAEGKFQIVKAQVPETDLYQYATTLRSLTGGRGIYSREFSHYAEMPKELEAKVIAAAKENKEEKEE